MSRRSAAWRSSSSWSVGAQEAARAVDAGVACTACSSCSMRSAAHAPLACRPPEHVSEETANQHPKGTRPESERLNLLQALTSYEDVEPEQCTANALLQQAWLARVSPHSTESSRLLVGQQGASLNASDTAAMRCVGSQYHPQHPPPMHRQHTAAVCSVLRERERESTTYRLIVVQPHTSIGIPGKDRYLDTAEATRRKTGSLCAEPQQGLLHTPGLLCPVLCLHRHAVCRAAARRSAIVRHSNEDARRPALPAAQRTGRPHAGADCVGPEHLDSSLMEALESSLAKLEASLSTGQSAGHRQQVEAIVATAGRALDALHEVAARSQGLLVPQWSACQAESLPASAGGSPACFGARTVRPARRAGGGALAGCDLGEQAPGAHLQPACLGCCTSSSETGLACRAPTASRASPSPGAARAS